MKEIWIMSEGSIGVQEKYVDEASYKKIYDGLINASVAIENILFCASESYLWDKKEIKERMEYEKDKIDKILGLKAQDRATEEV